MAETSYIDLSASERELVRKVCGKLRKSEAHLTTELIEMFSALAFHNEFTFHPRLYSGFATELVNSFLSYLDLFDEQLSCSEGKKSAEIGLGEKTALGIVAILQRTVLHNSDRVDRSSLRSTVKAVNSYTYAYLESFMKARFDKLLREQELMRRSTAKAMEERFGPPKP